LYQGRKNVPGLVINHTSSQYGITEDQARQVGTFFIKRMQK